MNNQETIKAVVGVKDNINSELSTVIGKINDLISPLADANGKLLKSGETIDGKGVATKILGEIRDILATTRQGGGVAIVPGMVGGPGMGGGSLTNQQRKAFQ